MTEPIAEPAILIEALVKRYGASNVPAVDGINLEVRRGEIFGLLGPNGADKTTTIGISTTRVNATAGRVRVVGPYAGPALRRHGPAPPDRPGHQP